MRDRQPGRSLPPGANVNALIVSRVSKARSSFRASAAAREQPGGRFRSGRRNGGVASGRDRRFQRYAHPDRQRADDGDAVALGSDVVLRPGLKVSAQFR